MQVFEAEDFKNNLDNNIIPNSKENYSSKSKEKEEKISNKKEVSEVVKLINNSCVNIKKEDLKDCEKEFVEIFDRLPFKNKVIFTYRKYEHLKSAVYLESFKDNPLGVYMFLGFENRFSKRRRYDVFDFVAWFNGEKDLGKLSTKILEKCNWR